MCWTDASAERASWNVTNSPKYIRTARRTFRHYPLRQIFCDLAHSHNFTICRLVIYCPLAFRSINPAQIIDANVCIPYGTTSPEPDVIWGTKHNKEANEQTNESTLNDEFQDGPRSPVWFAQIIKETPRVGVCCVPGSAVKSRPALIQLAQDQVRGCVGRNHMVRSY